MDKAFNIKGVYPKMVLMTMSGAAIPLTSIFIKTGRLDVFLVSLLCYLTFLRQYHREMFKTDKAYRNRVLLILALSVIGCTTIPEYIVMILALPSMFLVSLIGLDSYASKYIRSDNR